MEATRRRHGRPHRPAPQALGVHGQHRRQSRRGDAHPGQIAGRQPGRTSVSKRRKKEAFTQHLIIKFIQSNDLSNFTVKL